MGTRPEAVKVAPMMTAMRRAGLNPLLIDTGQQPGRVAEAIAPFGLTPDIGLDIERRAGSLRELINLVSDAVDRLLDTQLPAAVLVQGDTTTAMAVALTAHLRQVPVVHLEAGLRTGDPRNPFPEETNRRLIADLADLHLAPTPRAARALALEGRDGHRVVVTGNTVVDALATLLPAARARTASAQDGRLMRHLVVTVHRREAWGEGVRTVAGSVRELLARYPDLRASVVTHPNPVVAADVESVLAGTDRCDLLPPQPYDDMLTLLCSADVVLTDSGGLQEEAPSIGVPAVVTRWTTERPEGVEAGWADLVGLDRAAILEAVSRRLDDPTRPDTGNPYGDGAAADRSAAAVRWLLGGGARPEDWAGPAMTSHADDLASTR
ncbi:non-hydrolyzing UDP-N-acetylglucosamine 2-epimerase [Pedococcus dokdonensis]|uniref:non-hydrolyzing UDP-N-acetylglucosamine 2-epimerase n=1 Tax=Pedococcus dokdonensis TaxID=443156 RepID=UPI0012FD2E81|nr:UDP-N-acetylglucosamine 2-epimerase (non-hydrolyzing) [Pedococcus dokdonensis]